MFIYSILPWSADTLLLATEGNDLQWYLPRENRFEQIHTNKAQLAAEGLAIDANVTALHRVNDTLLWAGTYQGAYLINPLRGTVYNVEIGRATGRDRVVQYVSLSVVVVTVKKKKEK